VIRSATRRRQVAVLLLIVSALVSCNRTPEGPPAGPLAYEGAPQSWLGPVAVGKPRAWGLIRFGKEGLRATVTSVTLDTPPPEGLATHVELNSGELVAVGGIKNPKGAIIQSVPGSISGLVQVVVWFEPQRTGIEYFSGSTTIAYTINGKKYEARFPVGVGICSVQRVTATTPCDVGDASKEP
jgi:hypothetical protein